MSEYDGWEPSLADASTPALPPPVQAGLLFRLWQRLVSLRAITPRRVERLAQGPSPRRHRVARVAPERRGTAEECEVRPKAPPPDRLAAQ